MDYYVVLYEKKTKQPYVVCEGKSVSGAYYLMKVEIKGNKIKLPKKHQIAYLEKDLAENWKKKFSAGYDVKIIPKGKKVPAQVLQTKAENIKKLYKENSELAIQVAKALGYEIKVKTKENKIIANTSIIEYIVPQGDLADSFKNFDDQTQDLARDVWMMLKKKLTLSRSETEALNRLKQSVSNSSKWKEAMHRNNIFKAANSLKMKLPSSSF